MIKKLILYIKMYFKIINKYSEREDFVLQQKMPQWYTKYQYSFFGRILRFFALIILATPWHINWITEAMDEFFNIKFFHEIIKTETFLCLIGILVIGATLFLLFHCLLQMLIRIIFFKKIVKQSPVSSMQCLITGGRICRYTIYVTGIFLGIPGVDYLFKENGHIPVLKSWYMNRQISFFGANKVNCAITEGKFLEKNNIINNAAVYLQECTHNKEVKANTAFNEAILQGLNKKETTEYVLKKL